jgi:4-amino-4-deoxy-L-arabinose transferase-like glycosyltransferase
LTILESLPARLLLLERLFSALAGTAAVAALIVFARRELGTCVALAAGALLGTSFLHVRDSHSSKPDVAMSLAVVFALGFTATLVRKPSRSRALAAGIAIGLAMAMKPPAVLLLVPAYVAAVWGSSHHGWRRLLPATVFMAGLAAAAVFALTSPDLVVNAETRRQVWNIVGLVFPHLAPEAPTPPPSAAVPTRSLWEGHLYHALFSLRYGVGWLAVLTMPLALAWAFFSRNPLAVLSAVFAVTTTLVLGSSPAMLSRYMTPTIPAFALVLAGGAAALVRRLGPARMRAAALTLFVIACTAEPLARSIAFDRIAARTDTRVLATRWLAKNADPASVVGIAGTVFWSWGEPWVPSGLTRVQVPLDADALEKAGVRYLVTHDHRLFASHVDPDGLARLAPRLELLTEFSPFVGAPSKAVFEEQDAYYIPVAGFDAVERPGPIVRIYAFR